MQPCGHLFASLCVSLFIYCSGVEGSLRMTCFFLLFE